MDKPESGTGRSATAYRWPDRNLVIGIEDMRGASPRGDMDCVDQHQMNQPGWKIEAGYDLLHRGAVRHIQGHPVACAPLDLHFGRKMIAEHGKQF